MKNMYIVKVNNNISKTFTNKVKAVRYAHSMECKGMTAEIITDTFYPIGYIEEMKYHYHCWKKSNYLSIYAAYKNPSLNKVSSFNWIKNSISIPNSLKVISKNCHFYTTGSLTTDENNGEILFRYDTAYNVKTIPLSLLETN